MFRYGYLRFTYMTLIYYDSKVVCTSLYIVEDSNWASKCLLNYIIFVVGLLSLVQNAN